MNHPGLFTNKFVLALESSIYPQKKIGYRYTNLRKNRNFVVQIVMHPADKIRKVLSTILHILEININD